VAKLDIKLLLEADDGDTAAALAAIPLPARFEVVVVPPGEPRTKPRALNAALPLARGTLLVVFDAEDVPACPQLRRAAAHFARAPDTTACLQARLVIDNHEGRLPRFFAVEYAGLFNVLNPALAALGMPMPLGGTSMHVRTEVLRRLGGWDVRTVTEDAELGLRLALAGYRVGDLPSSTFEEAPARLRPWLRQRTRWMRGFLQTSLVHGRRPLANLAGLGALEGLCAVALVPGTLVSALAFPACSTLAGLAFLSGGFEAAPSFLGNLPAGLGMTLFAAGLVAILAPPILGCRQRGWGDLLPFVACLPAYYILVGLAAVMAVVELLHAPDRWNKTEHGLSRSSRSGRLTPVARNARGCPIVDAG
jgi:glycosyltransferase XagB